MTLTKTGSYLHVKVSVKSACVHLFEVTCGAVLASSIVYRIERTT